MIRSELVNLAIQIGITNIYNMENSACESRTIKDELYKLFVSKAIYPAHKTQEEWYQENWIKGKILGIKIPLFPVYHDKNTLRHHDALHVITGYGTDLKGELELVAWELGSNGCGNNFLRILHRLYFLPFCILMHPIACFKSFRRGKRCQTFYHIPIQKLLACDLKDIQKRMELGDG